MSYIALGLGVLLFLASTVENHNTDESAPAQKQSSRNQYKDGETNVNPQASNPQNDIKAFAVREDLKLDQQQSDSLKASKEKLEREVAGVNNTGQNNDIAAPIF